MSVPASGMWVAAGLTAALATGCRADSLGRVPESLIELYDLGRPDGTIELEVERDGRVREIEADVAIDVVPAAARDAVARALPGGEVTGAEREINAAGAMWELKVRHDGRGYEFVVDDAGVIHETERELTRGEAPPAVLEAAARAVSGATFVSVEVIERGDELEYHVKETRDGASYKIVLRPDGQVLRAVREARAEIEIPLRD